MLDLTLQLEYTLDNEDDYITHKLYQKLANIYQYIPYMSNHKSSIFKKFILQELCRFKLNCTKGEDFVNAQTIANCSIFIIQYDEFLSIDHFFLHFTLPFTLAHSIT